LFEAEGNFTMRNLSLQSSWGPYMPTTCLTTRELLQSFHVMLISIQAHTKVTTKHKKLETKCTHKHTYCDSPLSMMVVASSFFA
jgi:hypothetical protein